MRIGMDWVRAHDRETSPRTLLGSRRDARPRGLGTLRSAITGTVRLGTALLGTVRLGTALLGTVWLGTALFGTALLGTVWLGTALFGTVRLGTVLLGTVLLGTTLLSGCSSPGAAQGAEGPSPKTGRPVEIRYHAVAKNANFGLVNESHTSRTELYSSRLPIDAASTKVSPDEVLDAVVDYFREQDFFELAQPGGIPVKLPPGTTQVLGVTTPAGAMHLTLRPGASTEQARCFQTCAKAFFDVYNATMQLQSVDQTPDWKAQDGKSLTPGLQPRKGG